MMKNKNKNKNDKKRRLRKKEEEEEEEKDKKEKEKKEYKSAHYYTYATREFLHTAVSAELNPDWLVNLWTHRRHKRLP